MSEVILKDRHARGKYVRGSVYVCACMCECQRVCMCACVNKQDMATMSFFLCLLLDVIQGNDICKLHSCHNNALSAKTVTFP